MENRKFRRSFAEIFMSMRFASVLFFSLFIAQFSLLRAQTTTNCLEIENILADACSQPEGDNEMVRVLIGPNPITVANLTATWPPTSNFSFTGWRRDATTATKTQQINATITSCGYLIEPLNGIIPPNRKVIIITSYTVSATANSFANLADTLYVLYQNSTNRIAGHFANYGNPPAMRPLSLTYQGCTETVEYDRALLTGGDGAYIEFAQNGTANYGNNGCTAPIVPFSVEAGNNPAAVCPGGTVSLSGTIIGNSTFRQWTGGTGTFSSPSTNNTNYTLAANQTTPFWLYFSAKGACADTLKDSVLITIQQQNPINISASGPLSICTGTNLTLTASGGGTTYQWVGGPATAQYTINTPGTYIVNSSDACYNYQQSVTVTASSTPSISINHNDTIICANGAAFTATVTASGTITWNNGATGNSINITTPGQYIATVSNGCGTASDTLNVLTSPAANAQITNQLPILICPNTNVLLTGTGTGTLTWGNGQTGNSTTVNGGGNYMLISQTACGSDTAFITVEEYPLDAQFTADPTNGNAPLVVNINNQSVDNVGSLWHFGDGDTSLVDSPSHTYTQPGTYTLQLTVVNAQGCIDSASVEIVVVTEMTVELPNIFTPNGDNANDVYFIKTQGVSTLRAEIYNRWGQKMFSWSDPAAAWDGKSALGAKATPGVYFCIVEATDALGKTQTFTTTVTLIQ